MGTKGIDKTQQPPGKGADAAKKQKAAAIKKDAFSKIMQETKTATRFMTKDGADDVELTFKAPEPEVEAEVLEGEEPDVDMESKDEDDKDVKDSKEGDKKAKRSKGGKLAQQVLAKKSVGLKGQKQRGPEVKIKSLDEQLKELMKSADQQKIEGTKQVSPAEIAGRPDMAKLIQSKEFLEVMVANIRSMIDNKEERKSFQIDMKKDVLKGLKLNVEIDKEGNISTEFISDSREVRSTIQSNMETLREGLVYQGLKVKDMKITSV